jgi:hypothetical protein
MGANILEVCAVLHSLPYRWGWRIEAAGSSKMVVPVYQTTRIWCHIPEDCNLDTCCCDNLKCHAASITQGPGLCVCCNYVDNWISSVATICFHSSLAIHFLCIPWINSLFRYLMMEAAYVFETSISICYFKLMQLCWMFVHERWCQFFVYKS